MSILAFHSVDDNFHLGINNYSPKRFRNLINNLRLEGFRFVSLSDYLSDRNPRDISLTFDDGYESFISNVLPVLIYFNITATLFMPYNYLGENADWDYSAHFSTVKHLSHMQLKELLTHGIEIGSHGLNHTSLCELSPRLLDIELRQSKIFLEELLENKVNYISYPFGRYTAEIENCATELGYKNGFSLSYLKKTGYTFTHPRFAVYATDTTYSVLAKLNSGLLRKVEIIKGAIINSYSGGTILLNRLRQSKYSF